MNKWKYAAKDGRGKTVTGVVTADDRGDAIGELRKRNLTVVNVKQVSGSRMGISRPEGRSIFQAKLFSTKAKPRAKRTELILFTRQLATMVGAGIPLLEALEILEEQAETPGFKACCAGVVEQVRTGSDLSIALEQYPKVFVDLYVSMIKAGEISGQLDVILVRLAEYMEANENLRRQIKSAMTYPVVSLVLVVGIAMFLMIGIVPSFGPVFESLEVDLPGLTQFVMNLAFSMRDNAMLIIGGIVGGIFAFGAFRKTPRGKVATDYMMLKLPVFGPLFQKVAISRFSRTFSTLVRSGVPILAAMDVVSDTAGNSIVSKAVDRAKASVRTGETLSAPLAESPVFPPMVTKMIGIGERSGALETLLEKIAVFYDEQVSAEVKSLTSLIEPIMIAVMGFVVGTIVLAVFLPIFKLQEKLAG